MAVWKTENSVYTITGLEMVNRTLGASSKLTFTRVVAGSGRVPASKLMAQTELSGATIELYLANYNADENGSEITTYIDNYGFTEPFTLNQIGVYATSPDFDGEQLIHISQCEEVGADIIPEEGDTPVSFSYSLYLEHLNSSQTSVVIDPKGVLLLEGGNMIGALGLSDGYAEVDATQYSVHMMTKEESESDDNSVTLKLYNRMLSELDGALCIIDRVNGESSEYKIFGEHNIDLLLQLISGVSPATIEPATLE